MERDDNLGNYTSWMAMEEEELFQPSDRNDASGFSSILQQTLGPVEDTIPTLSDLENDSIFQTFVDLNNNYADNENMASGLSTPEPTTYSDCTSILPNYPGVIQGSPSTDLEDPVTLAFSFGVNPVFASARFAELLHVTPDSSTNRSRCSSTSDVPDKTIKKKPGKRLTSEVERKEKRKESNRRAAGKYRQKQREAEKYRQENHDRLMEEITKLRERNEFLERKLEFCTCHSRVCPSTEPQ